MSDVASPVSGLGGWPASDLEDCARVELSSMACSQVSNLTLAEVPSGQPLVQTRGGAALEEEVWWIVLTPGGGGRGGGC